jgi:glycosyltransferase involved in cell wall biosynthesis
MDYRANVDAVEWFASEVFPVVRRSEPRAEFWIVGSNPTEGVQRLAGVEGIHVTGRVPDVRPYLSHASAVVAPLRVARGVQNKVLEALSMERPVVCTPEAAEGLADGAPLQVTEDPAEMSRMLLEVLHAGNAASRPDNAGRNYVRQNYQWSVNLSRMTALVQTAASLAASDTVIGQTDEAA